MPGGGERERVIVAVDTPDLARAARYYREVLGCALVRDESPEFVMVALGEGTTLCLDAADPGAAVPGAPRLILPAGDLAALEREAVARGAVVHDRAKESPARWFSVLDPDGREVIFESRRDA